MYCSFLFINDRVCDELCMYTLYKLSMSVYGYVLYESVSCVCLFLVDEPVLFCIYVWIICLYVWMAPRKISCKLTGSPSLNNVFELNELNWIISAHSIHSHVRFHLRHQPIIQCILSILRHKKVHDLYNQYKSCWYNMYKSKS